MIDDTEFPFVSLEERKRYFGKLRRWEIDASGARENGRVSIASQRAGGLCK